MKTIDYDRLTSPINGQKELIENVSTRLNVEHDMAIFLIQKFLEKIHKEWVEERERTKGYKATKFLLEDLQENEIPLMIDCNKYNDRIEEVEIETDASSIHNDEPNKYTMRWMDAKSKEEEDRIMQESENEIKRIYRDFIEELARRKSEFEGDLETYEENKKRKIKMQGTERTKGSIAAIWYIVTTFCTVFGVWYGLSGDEGIDFSNWIAWIIVVVAYILMVIMACNYHDTWKFPYLLKLIIIPIVTPFIAIFGILQIFGSVDEMNREYKERRVIDALYDEKVRHKRS